MGRRRTSLDRSERRRIRLASYDSASKSRDWQHQRDLDVSQSANESPLLRLAERLALLHDDPYRLRETIGGLPSRADIHDLEHRLGERMDSLAVRFDRAFDPHLS